MSKEIERSKKTRLPQYVKETVGKAIETLNNLNAGISNSGDVLMSQERTSAIVRGIRLQLQEANVTNFMFAQRLRGKLYTSYESHAHALGNATVAEREGITDFRDTNTGYTFTHDGTKYLVFDTNKADIRIGDLYLMRRDGFTILNKNMNPLKPNIFRPETAVFLLETLRKRSLNDQSSNNLPSEEGRVINFILNEEEQYAYNLEAVRSKIGRDVILEKGKEASGYIHFPDSDADIINVSMPFGNQQWNFLLNTRTRRLDARLLTYNREPLNNGEDNFSPDRPYAISHFILFPNYRDFVIRVSDPNVSNGKEKKYRLKELRSPRTSDRVQDYIRQLVNMSGLEWRTPKRT